MKELIREAASLAFSIASDDLYERLTALIDSMDKQEPVAWLDSGGEPHRSRSDIDTCKVAIPLFEEPQPDRVAELEERLKEESQAASDMSYDLSRMGEKCLELEAQLSAIRQAVAETKYGVYKQPSVHSITMDYSYWQAILDLIKEGEEG